VLTARRRGQETITYRGVFLVPGVPHEKFAAVLVGTNGVLDIATAIPLEEKSVHPCGAQPRMYVKHEDGVVGGRLLLEKPEEGPVRGLELCPSIPYT